MDCLATKRQDSEPAWYCARTQPKHEHIAAANLVKRLGLQVFHPRLRLERATTRGVVRVVEPLFPCYVFVRCNLAERADDIRHITGISSLVGFGGKTPSVPNEVIDDLRQCFALDEPMAVEERLIPGAEVVVAEGALMGSRGVVLRVLPSRQRVQILLDFLGRTTLTEVEAKSLTVEERRWADMLPNLAMQQSSVVMAA